jgi:hypothetical protein
MKHVLLHAIQISVVTAISFLSIGSAISQEKEKGLASPDQSDAAGRYVPFEKLEITVPKPPPKELAWIYCCGAHPPCVKVSAFVSCPAGSVTMVCDFDGICLPIGRIGVKGDKLLYSK